MITHGSKGKRDDVHEEEESDEEGEEGEKDCTQDAKEKSVLDTRSKLRQAHHNFTRVSLDLDCRIKAFIDHACRGYSLSVKVLKSMSYAVPQSFNPVILVVGCMLYH